MKVLFLAGGISRRMWPLSWDKNLVDFFGRPLIYYTLETLKKAGISEVIIVGNENNFANLAKIGKSLGLKTEIVIQDKNSPGQGGAIISAKKYLAGPVLVCNANDIFEEKLYYNIFKKVKNGKFDLLLVGYKVKSYFPGGYLKVKNGNVTEIVEKPAPDKVPSNIVRIVVDFFQDGSQLVKNLEKLKTDPDTWNEEAIGKMIKDGKKVICLQYDGTWKFLKYPWHILDIMEYFFKTRLTGTISKSAKISAKATIDKDVVIGQNVRIFEGAIIRGPAYIGSDVIIGNNALVRESIIGDGTVIGYTTEITRSYIGKNCWFHTNYIGDSVIDDNVSLGSGAITANLRLDEAKIKSEVAGIKITTGRDKLGAVIGKGSRIGVNAAIMPGVKIGQNCVIGPGVILSKDLPNESFCILKQEHQIKKNRAKTVAKLRDKFRKKL